ncbi:MAG: SpoIIE family protein phosphatase, partial [Treponema sp.]|nr:SpoIIE family protein phosphatase [Treponema sp.]
KGVPSALYMVIAKTIIKEACMNAAGCNEDALCAKKNPFDVIVTVNEKLCENNENAMFVTAIVGILNIPTGKFKFINAGHNPPIVRRNGNFEYLRNEPCLVLGFLENAKYEQYEMTLEKGDILYLYTDGVTEAMNNKKEMYGEEKLLETVKNCRVLSPKDILLSVKNDVDAFSCGVEQSDDITMLCVKMLDRKELQIDADITKLNEIFQFINKELEKHGFSSMQIKEIDVAAEEIFVNIVNYAYDQKGGKVLITIYNEGKTVIRFEDMGKPYNPLSQKEPDLEKNLLERDIGGLGIYLVKKIMDTVTYRRSGGKNILEITKTTL